LGFGKNTIRYKRLEKNPLEQEEGVKIWEKSTGMEEIGEKTEKRE